MALRARHVIVVAGNAGVGTVYTERLIPTLEKMCLSVRFIGWSRMALAVEWPFACKYEYLQVGGGYKNLGLAPRYIAWVGRVYRRLKRVDSQTVVLALDLDAALGAALAKRVARFQLIYFVLDNFAMRPMIPRLFKPFVNALDRWVMRHSQYVVVPDENRIDQQTRDLAQFVVIRNAANDAAHEVSDELRQFDMIGPLRVYASGYLSRSRGIEWLLDVAVRLPTVQFRLAGTIIEPSLLERVSKLSNVEYLGRLPLNESLRECLRAHLIYAMYDPEEPLNKLAASNKWSDAMMAGRPILCNEGILSSALVRKHDIGYVLPYGNIGELADLLTTIDHDRTAARRKGIEGRKLYDREWSWAESEKRLCALLE